ncbi:unnamed protein product, partial [Mesorhabditis belari]|uniref:DUF4440 domain-containing protein n=1 Tax=Mesorhabditis belari TaxID=2138241 RepID=A0A915G5P8_9BILA
MSMTSDQAKSALEGQVLEYIKKLNNGEWEALEEFYHPNGVMVETDKSCLWGQKDIGRSLMQMSTECGKTTMSVSNSQYDGVRDYIIFETDFCFHTEKAGDLKGHYVQIWRLHNGRFVIYHDEYALI